MFKYLVVTKNSFTFVKSKKKGKNTPYKTSCSENVHRVIA